MLSRLLSRCFIGSVRVLRLTFGNSALEFALLLLIFNLSGSVAIRSVKHSTVPMIYHFRCFVSFPSTNYTNRHGAYCAPWAAPQCNSLHSVSSSAYNAASGDLFAGHFPASTFFCDRLFSSPDGRTVLSLVLHCLRPFSPNTDRSANWKVLYDRQTEEKLRVSVAFRHKDFVDLTFNAIACKKKTDVQL